MHQVMHQVDLLMRGPPLLVHGQDATLGVELSHGDNLVALEPWQEGGLGLPDVAGGELLPHLRQQLLQQGVRLGEALQGMLLEERHTCNAGPRCG